ncbi:MAG: nucleotidyltransferase domain-containing protein [Magnetococcus sp. DMHC-1]|nr:nucleotidyltransferase domain-containing protein [Magnetococcales bacterium]
MQNLDLSERHLHMLLDILAHHVPHAEVWVFGSRINGMSHEGSDVDLVLRNPTNLDGTTPAWADLREALEESNLPMLVDLHDWARLPEAFHKEIQRHHVVLQAPLAPNLSGG